MEDSTFFEIFSAWEILKDFDLSYEEIDSGNIGLGGDGGIDSIYVFHNHELIREDTELENTPKESQFDFFIIHVNISLLSFLNSFAILVVEYCLIRLCQ